MNIILSRSGNKPIYEQIVSQIQLNIMQGKLKGGDALPSIRVLANELGVSVITTKRAYTELEAQAFIETVQGKGSFVVEQNKEFLSEYKLRQIESLLEQALEEAKSAQISPETLHDMLDALIEEQGN